MASQEEKSLPTRSAEGETSEAPSKNAAKKAAKEKEKAEKAAKRAEQEAQEKKKREMDDTAKHLYGNLSLPTDPSTASSKKFTELVDLYDATENQEVTVDARIHNARVQSAKLAFLVLREGAHTIQAVIAEGGANGISRQMVKWCGGLNTESIVRVTGLVKPPKEPVTSTSISNHELHVEKCYLISQADAQLPIQVRDCMRAPPEAVDEQESETDAQGAPIVSLSSRLNNRILDARTAANLAIFQLQSGITNLFMEYMNKHHFTWIQSSKLAGAATEGGAGVFEVGYFDKKAYLTQSPQFFKQMAIAMDMKRVCEVGPVFRAENSNTHRHLTEVYLFLLSILLFSSSSRGPSESSQKENIRVKV